MHQRTRENRVGVRVGGLESDRRACGFHRVQETPPTEQNPGETAVREVRLGFERGGEAGFGFGVGKFFEFQKTEGKAGVRGGVVRELGEVMAEFGGGEFGPVLVHQQTAFQEGCSHDWCSDKTVTGRIGKTSAKVEAFILAALLGGWMAPTFVFSRLKIERAAPMF